MSGRVCRLFQVSVFPVSVLLSITNFVITWRVDPQTPLTMLWQNSVFYNKQLFAKGEVNIVEQSLRRSWGDYLTIFTEPKANNCFSIKTGTQSFVWIHICSRIVLIRSLHGSLHRLWISVLVEFGSKTNKQNTMKNKFIPYFCFIAIDFIHSCQHCLKMSSFSLEKTDFSQSIWPVVISVTTAFTILNCLEHKFLKGSLVQGWQHLFWKFSILSNILDL